MKNHTEQMQAEMQQTKSRLEEMRSDAEKVLCFHHLESAFLSSLISFSVSSSFRSTF
jgi:hypothetical protein